MPPHLWDVIDFIAYYLDTEDIIRVQATCCGLRRAGLASEVLNQYIYVGHLASDHYDSFSLWLKPRASRVRNLCLVSVERVGELPEGLKHLKQLVYLTLGAGVSVLPPMLATLLELEELELSNCTGLEILPDFVTQLANLTLINLGSCINLRTIPSSMSVLTRLDHLCLNGCQQLQYSAALWEIKSLTSLDVRHVPWQNDELDAGLWDLTNLETLGMSGNYLPPELGKLTQLTNLTLRHGVTEVPEDSGLCKLTNLETLQFQDCNEMHQLPPQISALSKLRFLSASGCGITTLPPELGYLKQLISLSLRDCAELVELPEHIGLLTSLKQLAFWNCVALRSLPSTLGSLSSLKFLTLRSCSSLVSLPDSIKELNKLQHLDFEGCTNLKQVVAPASVQWIRMAGASLSFQNGRKTLTLVTR